MSVLQQLQAMTDIVADTGNIDDIKRLNPLDATTNPSLVLKAIQSGSYDQTIASLCKQFSDVSDITNALIVKIGSSIVNTISGLVSTEVDARYSYDTQKTIEHALKIIDLYKQADIDSNRILIKIAGTWEGIQAAKALEAQGIHCNVTLIFCEEQAFASADANATLISPFVGRITDWHQAKGLTIKNAEDDPGVISVKRIYENFKAQGIQTIIMGASFRNSGQIIQLAGCDKLTISPALLDELADTEKTIERKLNAPIKQTRQAELTQAQFLEAIDKNPMAKEKLTQGIEGFINDQIKLETLIQAFK